MAQISPYLRDWHDPATGHRGLHFWCPGCREAHMIRTHPNGWTWNGDVNKPVFSPSVLVTGLQAVRDEEGRWTGEYVLGNDGKPAKQICHSFVGCNGATPGQIIFLKDSTHSLAGQTVDLATWPESES